MCSWLLETDGKPNKYNKEFLANGAKSRWNATQIQRISRLFRANIFLKR